MGHAPDTVVLDAAGLPASAGSSDVPAPPPVTHPDRRHKVKLGEELPIFCERCGYSLFGLPQVRCGQCHVLHFACPECNHHQPINTLRPAAQRVLGRVRAWALALSVLFRVAFFGLMMLAWWAMGAEWSYAYDYTNWRPQTQPGAWQPPPLAARPIDDEVVIAFGLLGVAFGLVARMLLLRWRRGALVGAALAAVVFLAVAVGVWFRAHLEFQRASRAPPVGLNFYLVALFGCACVVAGAVVVWPAWMALAHLFLPRHAATALLDWQRSQSRSGRESSLAR